MRIFSFHSQLLCSALFAFAIAHPIDYDDMGAGLHLADSPSSNTRDAGLVYDTGIFTRYPGDNRELEYAPPSIGELPFEGLRAKREIIVGEDGDVHDDSLDIHKDLFASLFEYTRPERDTVSNDSDIRVPLHGLVHAVETTLLNSASQINGKAIAAASAAEPTKSTTKTEVTPSNSEDDDRKQRSIEVFSTAKFEDTDHLTDKDLKFDPDREEAKQQDLGLLAHIAFSTPIRQRDNETTIKHITARSTSEDNLKNVEEINGADESATAADASDNTTVESDASSTTADPFHSTNITVIKTTNTTHIVPHGDVVHVQHQHIQQSIFHSNLAFLPTIPPHKVNIPTKKTKDDSSSEEGSDEDKRCGDSGEISGESNETGVADKTKCLNSKEQLTTATEDTVKVELQKKTQKLKEQVAEIEAEPVILSQGI